MGSAFFQPLPFFIFGHAWEFWLIEVRVACEFRLDPFLLVIEEGRHGARLGGGSRFKFFPGDLFKFSTANVEKRTERCDIVLDGGEEQALDVLGETALIR